MRKKIIITESQFHYIVNNANRLDEQKKNKKSPATTPLPPSTKFDLSGVIPGKTGKGEEKKVTDSDIKNAGTNILAPEIISLFAKNDISMSNNMASLISSGFILKAGKKGDYKKIFRKGLENDSLHIIPWYGILSKGNYRLNTLQNPKTQKKVRVSTSGNLQLYSEGKLDKPWKEFANQEELGDYMTDLNLNLWKKGEDQQYFLHAMKEKTKDDEKIKYTSGLNGHFFIMVKREATNNKIGFLNVIAPSTTSGGATKGSVGTKKNIENFKLTVDLSESYKTQVSSLDETAVKKLFLEKIKAKLDSEGINNFIVKNLNIISSSSNSWNNTWVAPTHSKSNKLLGGTTDTSGKKVPTNDYDFTHQPPTGTDDTAKNNKLAWDRGQTLLNAIGAAESEFYDGSKSNKTINWRVTDTQGKVDVVGAEGSGQYSKVVITGMAERKTDEDVAIPGRNTAVLKQVPLLLSAVGGSGGARIGWFSSHKAKYVGRNGKLLNKVRSGVEFSGLPKWLESILYTGV